MSLDPKLTDEEIAVWHAAYGTSFATKFEDWAATEGYEYASQVMSAERAVAVADAAVQRLREWREATRRPTERPSGTPDL
jgi:hypothetical protein